MTQAIFGKRPLKTRFITDGGLETSLIFHHGFDLPHFAAFEVLNQPEKKKVLLNYYQSYVDLAKKYNTGFIFESPTWRANSDYGIKMGYSQPQLSEINKNAVTLMYQLREQFSDHKQQIFISGCIGPRYDAYDISQVMTSTEAEAYHSTQIKTFKESNANVVTAMTINNIQEGLGITKAAISINIPVIISFTVETDGNLPSGEKLAQAIESIDKTTNSFPIYYMINCAHPSHFIDVLEPESLWTQRIMGIRANASCKSHAELDESTKLDTGNTTELAEQYLKLHEKLPNLMVYGGCCGTDTSHIEAICEVCLT